MHFVLPRLRAGLKKGKVEYAAPSGILNAGRGQVDQRVLVVNRPKRRREQIPPRRVGTLLLMLVRPSKPSEF